MADVKIKQLKERLDKHSIPISNHAKERHLDPDGRRSAKRLESNKTAQIVDEAELRNVNSVFRSETMMDKCVQYINDDTYLPRIAARQTQAQQSDRYVPALEVELDLRAHPELFQYMLAHPSAQLLCYTQNAETLRTRALLAIKVNMVLQIVPITKENQTGIEIKTMYPMITKDAPAIDVRYAPEVFRRQRAYTQDWLQDVQYKNTPKHLLEKMHAIRAEFANSRYANHVVNVQPTTDGTSIRVISHVRLDPESSTTRNEPYKVLEITTQVTPGKAVIHDFKFAMCTRQMGTTRSGAAIQVTETTPLDEPVPKSMQDAWLSNNMDYTLAIAAASRAPFKVSEPMLDQRVDDLLKLQKQRQQTKKTKRTPIANAPKPVDHTNTKQYG